MFYGRREELKTLNEFYQGHGTKAALIYGRRRLGKSELIKQSSKSFQGTVLYYQCLKAVDSINAKGLSSLLKEGFPNAFLSENSSFMEVLQAIFLLSKEKEILLILDEYCYLENREAIDSKLQSLLDQSEREKENVKLILSGSYVSVMEKLLQGDGPLHGRFAVKMLLRPFDYYDASSFYVEETLEDKVRYYCVFGGVPYYLSMINPSLGFEENVKRLIVKEGSLLESEIAETMEAEYSKIANASLLMSLLAAGKHSYSDLRRGYSAQTSKSDFSYLLSTLEEMDLVRKESTVNNWGEKKSYYELADNLYAYYYEVVYPRLAFRPTLPTDLFYTRFLKDETEERFIPHRFESLCGEYLLRKNKAGKNDPFFLLLGSYAYNDPKQHKNGQFDLVSEEENGYTFYECKFTKEKIGKSVIQEEKRQLKELGIPYWRLGFFSRSGFEGIDLEDGNLYFDLKDLFADDLA